MVAVPESLVISEAMRCSRFITSTQNTTIRFSFVPRRREEMSQSPFQECAQSLVAWTTLIFSKEKQLTLTSLFVRQLISFRISQTQRLTESRYCEIIRS